MKTLYITSGRSILVDSETNLPKTFISAQRGIDDIFLAEEPMHVSYSYGEMRGELDVEKGDIIITFYDDRKNRLIVVKNEKWAEDILDRKKKEQEEKERWAASKKEPIGECDPTCKAS